MAKYIDIFLNGEILNGCSDLDIQLQMSIKDIQDPSSVSSFYTYDFEIPGTAFNNKIFKNIFEINNQSQFKPNANNTCELRVDGNSVFIGRLQLNEIIKGVVGENDIVQYNVTLYSYTKSVFTELNGKYLHELDFSEYAHKRTQDAITGSFTHTTEDGYVYPCIDYNIGFEWNNSKFPGRPDIGYPSFGICDMYPATYVKTIIDKIFETIGYTYNSELFNSEEFKKMIVPYGNHSISSTPGWFYGATGSAQYFRLWNAIGGQNAPYRYLNFDVNSTAPYYAPMNSYIHKGDYYVSGKLVRRDLNYYPIVIPGTYYIKFDFEYVWWDGPIHNFYVGTTNPGAGAVTPEYNNAGQLIGYSRPTIDFTSYTNKYTRNIPGSGTYTFETKINCNAGDLLFFFIADADMNYSQGGSGGATNYLGVVRPGATLSISYGDIEVLDDNVYLQNAMPENILVTDFLADINKMFNLYWEVDKNSKNVINIQTYDYYYNNSGRSYLDWNYKLDLDSEFKVSFLNEEQKMQVNLKYANAGDYYNNIWHEKYGESFDVQYGQKRLTFTGNTFNSEIYNLSLSVIQASVSNTPYQAGASNFVTPCYWNSLHQGQNFNERATDVGMRILFYGGLRDIGPGAYDNWNLNGTAGYTSGYYPYAGAELIPYSAVTRANSDLNFESSNLFYEEECTDNNLYTKYWMNYWNMILNDETRIVECKIKLEEMDIANLNMNDVIILKEAFWRILEIKYNVGDKLHEVKLIKAMDNLDYTPKVLQTSQKSQKPRWNIGDLGHDNYIRGTHIYVRGDFNVVDDTVSPFLSGRTSNVEINGSRNYVGPANWHSSYVGSDNVAYNNVTHTTVYGSNNALAGYNSNISITGSYNYVATGVSNVNIVGDNVSATTSNTTYYGTNKVDNMTHNINVTGNDGGNVGQTYQQPFTNGVWPSNWYNTDTDGFWFLSGDAWTEGGITKNSTIVATISQMQLNWTSMYPNSSNPMTTWNAKTWIHTLQSGSTIRVFNPEDPEVYGIWRLTDFYDYPGQDSSYFNMTFLEGAGQFNNGDTLVVGNVIASSGVTISISDSNPSTGYTDASGGYNIQMDFIETGFTSGVFSYVSATTIGMKDTYVSWAQYNKGISNLDLYYSLGYYETPVLLNSNTYDLAQYDTLYWKAGSSSISGECGFDQTFFSGITRFQLNYSSSGGTTNNAYMFLSSIKTGTTMTMYKLGHEDEYETFIVDSIIDASWDNFFDYTVTSLYGNGTITVGEDIVFQSGSTPTWHRYTIDLPIECDNQDCVNLIWKVTGTTGGLFNFDDFEFYSRPTYYHLDYYDYMKVKNSASGVTEDHELLWNLQGGSNGFGGPTAPNIFNRILTGTTTLDASYGMIACNGNSYDINLPSVTVADSRIYYISKTEPGTVTLKPFSGDTIAEQLSLPVTYPDSVQITAVDGVGWIVMSGIYSGGTNYDLSAYWTSAQTVQEIYNQTSGITVDLSGYYTSAQTDIAILSATTGLTSHHNLLEDLQGGSTGSGGPAADITSFTMLDSYNNLRYSVYLSGGTIKTILI